MISFTTPLPPSVNEYLKKRVGYVAQKPFVQVYESAQAKAFKNYMVTVLTRVKNKQGSFYEFEGYVNCEVVIYFSRLGSDADNIFKCLLDSFTENKLISDDSKILPRVKNVFVDKDYPRVEVVLTKSNKVGIFEDENHLKIFKEKNCSLCKREKRNCSIMKKSLENKITQELDSRNMTCMKKTPGGNNENIKFI